MNSKMSQKKEFYIKKTADPLRIRLLAKRAKRLARKEVEKEGERIMSKAKGLEAGPAGFKRIDLAPTVNPTSIANTNLFQTASPMVSSRPVPQTYAPNTWRPVTSEFQFSSVPNPNLFVQPSPSPAAPTPVLALVNSSET